MTRQFESVNISEFIEFVRQFNFRREITEVHLHHTWKPTQEHYSGHDTILGMWRHHTKVNGWSDIGQHVSIGPDGLIWLCRNFNWSPASASGFNGNSHAGPFMIEMIGDFDKGRECLTEQQNTATLSVIKAIQTNSGISADQLRFHNEMSAKSCPGTSMDKEKIIKEVEELTLPKKFARSRPFPDSSSRLGEMIRAMDPDESQTDDMSWEEHGVGFDSLSYDTSARGEVLLNENTLEQLANHAFLMDEGKFEESNLFETSKGDVDRVFETVLPAEVIAARAQDRKLKLLFYAHGGLVSEENALKIAAFQLNFWRSNNIYPIFFIWKSGAAETIKNLVTNAFNKVSSEKARGPASNISDTLIEALVRELGGKMLWSGMKANARSASEPDGAAFYVAKKTAKFLKEHSKHVEIHTIGHSAGAIFQAHYMNALVDRVITVDTAQFFAPAIRVNQFLSDVAPMIGHDIGHLAVYTMNKRREKADTVTSLYRKSLLYLISRALERKKPTDILGLQESIERSKKLKKIFGLGRHPKKFADVVWSPSSDSDSGSASDSRTHGGFDEDRFTMESAARRILGFTDAQPIHPLPTPGNRGVDDWNDQFNWPSDFPLDSNDGAGALAIPSSPTSHSTSNTKDALVVDPESPNPPTSPTSATTPTNITTNPSGRNGRKKALCIGIDQYQNSPLLGCVNDAKLWKSTLEAIDYQVQPLLDTAATARNILDAVAELIGDSQPADSLVIQFAGHGTQFEDLDGDESGGDTPLMDECLCAVDCEVSNDGLVIDDQLRQIFDRIPNGVNVTCFFDCCHSGTASRMMARASVGPKSGSKVRYLKPSETMRETYRRLQSRLTRPRSSVPLPQREVLFAACRSSQLAYETNGQGDFTAIATQLIQSSQNTQTNLEVQEQIIQSFGPNSRQTPELSCHISSRSHLFLPG